MKSLLKECAEFIRLHHDSNLSVSLLNRISIELSRNDGYAVVSTVSREDIISAGYDADSVDDSTLEHIAESMGDDHTEYGGYWTSLKDACEEMVIPRLLKDN